MSATEGLKIGVAIFDILKNNSQLLAVSGMTSSQIQPAPLKEKANAIAAVLYELDAVNPVNIKRILRAETAPLYIVDFTLECIHKNYRDSVFLADNAAQALQKAANGRHPDNIGGILINGITLESASEDYNLARKYYSKRLSFQARVLL